MPATGPAIASHTSSCRRAGDSLYVLDTASRFKRSSLDMSERIGRFFRYLRAAGVDASVVCARSEGFWSTPRRAFLIAHRSSPVLLRTLPYLCSVHRACKCTVTTHRWSRTRRRTSAAGPRFVLLVLGRCRVPCSAFHVGPSTCGDIGGETRAARPRPRLVKCVCFQKGLLRRRVAPEAASPSRSDAALSRS